MRNRRENLAYSQRDVSQMTGLTVNTISGMENRGTATLNTFLLVCRALEIQPREIFAEDILLEPLYELPPSIRKQKTVSRQLDDLVFHSDYFNEDKRVADVTHILELDPALSGQISVYLTNLCKKGTLEYSRKGKINFYRKKISE